jgi:hypothetical protein
MRISRAIRQDDLINEQRMDQIDENARQHLVPFGWSNRRHAVSEGAGDPTPGSNHRSRPLL